MILVVGPGRCGTSTVARILHERLGISMGRHFREPDATNPDGFYEDLLFRNLNSDLLEGRATFPDWIRRLNDMLRVRDGEFGIKDPRLCYVLPFYLSREPIVIRCKRPAMAVAISMAKCYGWSVDDALKETKGREFLLDRVSYPMATIDFTNRRTDGDIESELREIA